MSDHQHNIEANEETKELELTYAQDAIGTTLFSKTWLLSTLSRVSLLYQLHLTNSFSFVPILVEIRGNLP